MTYCDHCGCGYNEDSVMSCTDENGEYCSEECRDSAQESRGIAQRENMMEAFS